MPEHRLTTRPCLPGSKSLDVLSGDKEVATLFYYDVPPHQYVAVVPGGAHKDCKDVESGLRWVRRKLNQKAKK